MTTPIRAGLAASSPLQALVKDGVQALEAGHRTLIEPPVRPQFADSLDIDEAFRRGHDQEHRWDYLLGHQESRKIIALEPHTANNHEISTVIEKREASLRHLSQHLKTGVFVADWFWVASGKVDFVPMEKAIARLNQNGIRFVGKALLQKSLPKSTAGEPAKRLK